MRLVRNHGWLFGAAFALVAALVGCDLILGNELNPKYCAAHPDDADCLREMPTGHFPCKSSADCVGQQGEPACTEPGKNGFGICVQCTVSDTAACVGTTPLCGEENVCRGCSKHADCASAACLPDGSCVDEGTIAYVAGMGTGTACTRTAPCGTLAAAVGKGKAYVKVAAGAVVKDTQVTVIDGKAVTILADEGAKLDRDGDGAILEVRSAGADVKIFDLEITGASGSSGANGIDVSPNGGAPKLTLTRVKLTGNQGLGLSSTGGALTVTQSTIASNAGGGVSITNATFDITNNFIYRNGNQSTSSVGGLSVRPMGQSRLERNTIVDNQADAGTATAGGVFCDVAGFVAAGNIIFRNVGGPTANVQTFGSCTYGNSFVMAGASPVDEALAFAHSNTQPFDYHLTAASPTTVRDAGGACTGTDVDGDPRPQGAACDLGADELKP